MAIDLAVLLAAVRGEPLPTQAVHAPSAPTPTQEQTPLLAERPSVAKVLESIAASSTDQEFLDHPDDDFGVSYRPRREQTSMQRRRWSRLQPPIPLVAIERPDEPARLNWWVQPVAGWREGLLVLHNIARDETFAIPLQGGGSL